MKTSIASKVGKNISDLVITRSEEFRESIEEIDLMKKSVTKYVTSSKQWQYSLRENNFESSILVPVGNIFSGLYCKIIQNSKKPMKEVVRKPRPSANFNQKTKNFQITDYSLPGFGGASKHWKERSISYKYRKSLHESMKDLQPCVLHESQGLQIIGQNMFRMKRTQMPEYSYERRLNYERNDREKSDLLNIDEIPLEMNDSESQAFPMIEKFE